DVGSNDALPDPGSADSAAAAARQGATNASEPIWVGKDVSGVRVRLDDGSAEDVKLHVIDSFDGKKPDANVESTGTPATPTAPTTRPRPRRATERPEYPAAVGRWHGLGNDHLATGPAGLRVAPEPRRRRTRHRGRRVRRAPAPRPGRHRRDGRARRDRLRADQG